MRAFAKISSVVLFILLLPLLSQAASPSPIKYGINVSYIHSFCDVNNRSLNFPIQSGLSVFQGQSMNGFGIGANINYNLFDNQSLSHSLEIRSNYEMFNNERVNKSFGSNIKYIPSEGNTVDIVTDTKEHSRLKLNYVNVDVVYCFRFMNKRVGIEIGPSLSFLVSNEMSTRLVLTHPNTKVESVKPVVENKEIEDMKKFNLTFNLGLNFPMQLGNFEVVPYVSYKPRTIYEKESGNAPMTFKTNNLSAGFIVRY